MIVKALISFTCFATLLLFLGMEAKGQSMSIGAQGNKPDSSAMLDVTSSSRGFLMPRLTKAQRMSISTPAQGLMVFQKDFRRGLYIYDTAFSAWDHILDSTEIKLLMDSLGSYGIDSVLNLGNDAGGNGIFNLDTVVIGDTTGDYVLHIKDTTSNLLVNASFGTGMLVTSKYNPRIYLENQSHSDSNKLMSLGFDGEELYFGSLLDNGQTWKNQFNLAMSTEGRVGINQLSSNTSRLTVFRSATDSTDFGAGQSSIYGYRGGTNANTAGGTGWAEDEVDAAVKGYSYWGNNYTAGVAGYNFMDFGHSAGVIGSSQGAVTMGALAYNDASLYRWGVFTNASANIDDYLVVNATLDSNNRVTVARTADVASGDFGPDRSTIYGYRGGSATAANGGTGWSEDGVDAAIKGYSFWGNNYTAGLAGYNFNDFNRSAGVIGSDQSASNWGALGFRDSTGTSWGMYTAQRAFVGDRLSIGGTSPNASLSIQNNLGDFNGGLNLKDNAGNDWYLFQDPAQGLKIRDDATDVLTITNTGNVGIGTTSPTEKLEVAGSAILSNTRYESGTFFPGVSNASGTVVIIDVSGALGDYWNAEIRVTGQSGTEQCGATWIASKPNLADDVFFNQVSSFTTNVTYLSTPTITYNSSTDQITVTKPASALSSGVTVFFVNMESQAYNSVHPTFN